jgi:hypothetical protein
MAAAGVGGHGLNPRFVAAMDAALHCVHPWNLSREQIKAAAAFFGAFLCAERAF